jgi:putative transposase
MVRRPEDYAWSSFSANALGKNDRLVTPHPVLLALGDDSASRNRAYFDLFRESLESPLIDAIREATNSGYPLASASFMSSDLLPPGRKTVRGRAGRPPNQIMSGGVDSLEIGL